MFDFFKNKITPDKCKINVFKPTDYFHFNVINYKLFKNYSNDDINVIRLQRNFYYNGELLKLKDIPDENPDHNHESFNEFKKYKNIYLPLNKEKYPFKYNFFIDELKKQSIKNDEIAIKKNSYNTNNEITLKVRKNKDFIIRYFVFADNENYKCVKINFVNENETIFIKAPSDVLNDLLKMTYSSLIASHYYKLALTFLVNEPKYYKLKSKLKSLEFDPTE